MDALPEVIRRYVLAVAESTQTPVDMAAVEALGIVSLCCQGKYFIRGNADWAEPLNTYMVVIMEPAERKSSVLSMMIRPVEVYEKTENERRSPEIVKSQMELSKLEKEKRSLVERASKGKATEEAYRNRAVRPRPRKVLLLISPFSTSGCTANTMVNAGWMMLSLALPILSTRMVSPLWPLRNTSIFTLRLYRPLMISKIPPSAETTAAQPLFSARTEVSFSEVTSSTKSRSGFTGSYSAISLALFLISSPKSTVGSRSFSAEAIPEGIRSRYQDLIETILSDDNEQQPISLDDDAQAVLEGLFNEIESRLKGDLAEISDWAGKFVGAVLRISGILHVMKYPKDSMFDSVDRETMENAAAIGRYFLMHAKAAYSLMGADTVNKDAQHLLSLIKRERLTEFSRRDAMRLCRSFKTADSMQPVLDRLFEYGYLAAKPLPPAHGAGRKPSEVYLTNPAVLEDFAGEGRS